MDDEEGHSGLAAPSRAARTKGRLQRAALEAFAELGWQGTRVEDIVQRAGVSHGTFYTYYDNKAAILGALVHGSRGDFEALASDRWEADNVRGALERVIGGFLDLYQRDALLMRTWMQAAREDPGFGQLYREARAMFVERVSTNVAAAVAAGGRTTGPPAQTVASTLVSMVEHFAYCWMVLGEEHEREDAIESLVLVWGAALNALVGFEVVPLDKARGARAPGRGR